ncbi:hypothetical protein LCGC14_0410220 [marine sediment metagenome]|uniref:Uncharacterized protein n=1 Tax=marine sediment metagenome TaxID=412755 RepID=A0A0F9W388_9ZZZZ
MPTEAPVKTPTKTPTEAPEKTPDPEKYYSPKRLCDDQKRDGGFRTAPQK